MNNYSKSNRKNYYPEILIPKGLHVYNKNNDRQEMRPHRDLIYPTKIYFLVVAQLQFKEFAQIRESSRKNIADFGNLPFGE